MALSASLVDYLASSYKAPLGVGFAVGAGVIIVVGALAPGFASYFGDPGLAIMALFVPSFLLAAIGFRLWVMALKRNSQAREQPPPPSRPTIRR